LHQRYRGSNQLYRFDAGEMKYKPITFNQQGVEFVEMTDSTHYIRREKVMNRPFRQSAKTVHNFIQNRFDLLIERFS
jgi:hypothetical protein